MRNAADKKKTQQNAKYWDKRTPELMATNPAYDTTPFLDGVNTLSSMQIGEMGYIRGKRLLHLQSKIGLDSLSWVRLGAKVTAVDFSEEAVRVARELSEKSDVKAEFIHCDIYDAPKHITGTFHRIYSGCGAIRWLPGLREWAMMVAHFMSPDGELYLLEEHPMLHCIRENGETGVLEMSSSYFERNAIAAEDGECYQWQWSLSQVIGALMSAGLEITYLREHDILFEKAFESMIQTDDGWWRLPDGLPRMPLSFSLKAVKRHA